MDGPHIPVLLTETLDALDLKPGMTVVDCTAGFGGHSSKILERIGDDGLLICIDRDPEAIAYIKKRFAGHGNVEYYNFTFDRIGEALHGRKADAILADIGISSYQYDVPERGFSYRFDDAKLDMRMDQTADTPTAADILNTLPERDLAEIFRKYGDEKYASSIARNIVREREKNPIETSGQLVDIIRRSMPAKALRGSHPAKAVYQSLRVYLNAEIEILENAIDIMFDCLKVGGTLSIISFNSCDTRTVKLGYRKLCEGCICPREAPVCTCGRTPRGRLKHKPIEASEQEIAENNRSRSAQLRSIVKLKD